MSTARRAQATVQGRERQIEGLGEVKVDRVSRLQAVTLRDLRERGDHRRFPVCLQRQRLACTQRMIVLGGQQCSRAHASCQHCRHLDVPDRRHHGIVRFLRQPIEHAGSVGSSVGFGFGEEPRERDARVQYKLQNRPRSRSLRSSRTAL